MTRALIVWIIVVFTIGTANAEEPGKSVPLSVSLGSEGIKAITASEFTDFVRLRAKKPVTIDRTFWDVVLPTLEAIKGPTKERAAPFLRKNFGSFLDDYQKFLLVQTSESATLQFTQETVGPYLDLVGKSCTGSPCKTPPCCGADGVECDPCPSSPPNSR